jgi:hypothetical protein
MSDQNTSDSTIGRKEALRKETAGGLPVKLWLLLIEEA